MAIDPRISLTPAPTINVGQRFAQSLQNVQRMQRMPFENQLLELQTELAQAQQPAQLMTAERAASPQLQEMQNLTQEQQLGIKIAQSVKPFLDSNNTLGAISELTKLNEQNPNLGLADDIQELQSNPEQYKAQVESILQLGGVTSNKQRPVQFGAQQTFKDSQGNLFFGTQKKDPISGEVETVFSALSGDQSVMPQGQLELVSGLGQTADEKAKAESAKLSEQQTEARRTKAVDAAIKKGAAAFDRIEPLKVSLANYDEAIAAIDSGAESGVISSFLPTIRESSIKLDNVKKRLGLDVVGNTTFGALSESELKFALDSALPTKLNPQQLREWLVAKKLAQQKVMERVTEAASFLSSGENTIKDWLQYDQARQINSNNQQPQSTNNQKVIKFDAQGNIIQ